MKKKLITLILAITSILVVGCSNDKSQDGLGDELSDPTIGFNLKFPKEWHNNKSIGGVYTGSELEVDEIDSIVATEIKIEYKISNNVFANLVTIYAINNEDMDYLKANNKSLDNIKLFDKNKIDYEVKTGSEKTFVIKTPKIETLDAKIKNDEKYKQLLMPANKLIEYFKTVTPVEAKQQNGQQSE